MQGTRAHDGTGDTMGQGPSLRGGSNQGTWWPSILGSRMVTTNARQPMRWLPCVSLT